MKILVCVDGSPQSFKAVEKAVEIANGCNVHHVAAINVVEKDYYPIMEQGTRKEIEHEIQEHKRLMEELMGTKEKILNKAAHHFNRVGIEIEKILVEGHPADKISEIADKQGFDMIIMGSRGRGGLKKLLLGSVSNAVIQESKASVLIVK